MLMKPRKILKIIVIISIAISILGGIYLIFNQRCTKVGKELFSDDIKSIAFLDFDETRYETEDINKIQSIKDILFSFTYAKIRNPWMEGGYIFEIITDREKIELVIAGDVVIINEETYRISSKTLAEQLIEIINL